MAMFPWTMNVDCDISIQLITMFLSETQLRMHIHLAFHVGYSLALYCFQQQNVSVKTKHTTLSSQRELA